MVRITAQTTLGLLERESATRLAPAELLGCFLARPLLAETLVVLGREA
jgi:hypothetical protein